MKSSWITGLSAALIAITGVAEAQSSATRDWRTWPFSRESPWNHPIGNSAAYTSVQGLNSLYSDLNYDQKWTSSIAVASSSDPVRRVYRNAAWPATNWQYLAGGGTNCHPNSSDESMLRSNVVQTLSSMANPYSTTSTPDDSQWKLPSDYHRASSDMRWSVHMPNGKCPSPDTDGYLAVFQPDGWVLDSYGTVVFSNGDILGDFVLSMIDARSDGTGYWNGRRASMLPSFAGMIRTGEISSGKIPHALAVLMSPTMLKEQAQWPAYAFDRNSGYSGSLPMGALLAIPANVNIDSIGLSPTGRIMARALQNYGAYIVDRGGDGGVSFLAELGNPEIRWSGYSNDLSIMTRHLKWVSNNGPNSIGGGGTPRTSFAPPFYDEVGEEPEPELPPSDPEASKNEFVGRYYSTANGAMNLVHTRVDSKIDFSWGKGSPDSRVPIDKFAVVWEGEFDFSQAGSYEFTSTTDDGMRVFVDGSLIIDEYFDQGPTTYQASKDLSTGTHSIRVEYYENGGGAVARLNWTLKAAAPVPEPPSSGPYDNIIRSIVASHSGKCLDIRYASTSSGALLQQWACHGQAHQKFKFVPAGSGVHQLRPTHNTALCLTRPSQASQQLSQENCSSSNANQRWAVQDRGNGLFELTTPDQRICMDVLHDSYSDGAAVGTYSCGNGWGNQQFRLIP